MARAKSGGRKRGISAWLLVAIGLLLGAAMMWGAERYFARGKPFSGIASLFKGDAKTESAARAQKKKSPPKAAVTESDKPELEFYSVLPGESASPPGKAGAGPFALQAGSFANFEDADRLKARLALMGLEARIEAVSADEGGAHYRVRLGPYHTKKDLSAVQAKLNKKGIEATLIKLNAAGA